MHLAHLRDDVRELFEHIRSKACRRLAVVDARKALSLSVHNRVSIAVYAAPPCVDGDYSCQRALVNFEAVQNRHPSTDRHKMSKFIIVREASRKSGANCVNPSKWRGILAKQVTYNNLVVLVKHSVFCVCLCVCILNVRP